MKFLDTDLHYQNGLLSLPLKILQPPLAIRGCLDFLQAEDNRDPQCSSKAKKKLKLVLEKKDDSVICVKSRSVYCKC